MSKPDKLAKIGIRVILDAAPDRPATLPLIQKLDYEHALDKADSLLPPLIPKLGALDPRWHWQDAFNSLGTDAKTIAQKINDEPTGEAVNAALDDFWERKFGQYDETPLEFRVQYVFEYSSSGPIDGHRGFFAGQVSVPGAAKFFESEAILRHMLQSFPQGALVIEPQWMDKVMQEDEKHKFIIGKEAEIKAATDKYFAEGGSLAKCGALLGATNAVRIQGVVAREIHGRKVYTMVVATTDQHALDGVNLWEAAYDPAHPDVVIFSNTLLGKHKLTFIMDWANNVLGKRLMTTTWKTVQLSIEAEAAGIPLEKYIADRHAAGDPRVSKIARSRYVFAGMDGVAFIPATIRKHLGTNLNIERTHCIILDARADGPVADKLLSLKPDTPESVFSEMNLRVEKQPQGFFVHRAPADPFLLMHFGAISVPPALGSAALNAARNPAEQLMDSTMVAKIREDVTEHINRPILTTLLEQRPASSAKMIENMRRDTAWTSVVDDYLLTEVTPDLEAQVRDVLKSDAQWSDIPDLLLEKAVLSAARETICLPLLAPQAYVEKITSLTVYETMKIAVPTPVTLENKVKALTQAADAMDSVVQGMKQQLGDIAKDSAEYKEKEKEIYEKEQKVKELTEDKVGVEQMSEEMKKGEEGFKDIDVSVKEMEKDPKKKIFEHGK